MLIYGQIEQVREAVKAWKKEGKSVGFVPTMGYLHEGHKSLIDAARRENDKVVVSIFVNPMQFGPAEDLDSYPRDLNRDAKLCEDAGVDIIFHPEADEITDLNRIYLEKKALNVELLGQGFTWLDTGTHESLVDATNFVKTVETHQHRKIACLEEIAYLNGWITKDEVLKTYELVKKNQYGQYLKDVLDGKYREQLY